MKILLKDSCQTKGLYPVMSYSLQWFDLFVIDSAEYKYKPVTPSIIASIKYYSERDYQDLFTRDHVDRRLSISDLEARSFITKAMKPLSFAAVLSLC